MEAYSTKPFLTLCCGSLLISTPKTVSRRLLQHLSHLTLDHISLLLNTRCQPHLSWSSIIFVSPLALLPCTMSTQCLLTLAEWNRCCSKVDFAGLCKGICPRWGSESCRFPNPRLFSGSLIFSHKKILLWISIYNIIKIKLGNWVKHLRPFLASALNGNYFHFHFDWK